MKIASFTNTLDAMKTCISDALRLMGSVPEPASTAPEGAVAFLPPPPLRTLDPQEFGRIHMIAQLGVTLGQFAFERDNEPLAMILFNLAEKQDAQKA